MSELGAISSYMLSMQQVQLSLIKNSVDVQQKMIETLFSGDSSSVVPPSANLGHNVDVSI